MTTYDWEREAVCRTTDPELWFPSQGESGRVALDICWNHCPVRISCLDAALAEEQRPRSGRHGIRGGYTPEQRAHLQRRRTTAANRADATPTN
ncbi:MULTISPECIES: WhiB family transcriptional regulator [Streptomyces]|uniref:WhiB family transcriptional regulator n=1 Tax=Streptomyces TaxID=1883 RepID=UPI00186B3043|nr:MULTISPECIES: WhiB family transcriptional regulator [Streptomyces]